MEILLVNPNSSINKSNNFHLSFYARLNGRINILSAPLAFQMLAAVTPKHHNISAIDETYQNINFNAKYDIVGITAMTSDVVRAYEIADEFRKKNIPVVIGGSHASILPNEAKQHADSVVIGEAEITWPKLLKDFEKKKLKPFYNQKKPVDINKIPTPRRDIINRSFIAAGVQSSRGCPYKCKFCFYSNSLHGRVFRKRSISKIIDEIKNIPQRFIIFHDSSLTIDIEHTKNLFKAMKNLNKKFMCLGNVDVLSKDDELLALAAEAGCIQWHVGFESISTQVLIDIEKKTNKVENYLKAVEKIHNHGMYVHGFFIFGFDKDPLNVFEETMKFVKKSKLDSADFSILVPYPGTILYDELLKQDRINTNDWSKYKFQKNIVFRPNNLSEQELFKNVKKVVYSYFSYPLIAGRLRNQLSRGISKFHPILFMIDNIFSRSYYLKQFKHH